MSFSGIAIGGQLDVKGPIIIGTIQVVKRLVLKNLI